MVKTKSEGHNAPVRVEETEASPDSGAAEDAPAADSCAPHNVLTPAMGDEGNTIEVPVPLSNNQQKKLVKA